MKFLHETYGVDALKQIWGGGAAAIPGVTGKGIEVLERDWHNRIKRRGQPTEAAGSLRSPAATIDVRRR